jgi:glycosyltransferase involved in cell wall biosynthesis
MIALSILICSIPERKEMLHQLLDNLGEQQGDNKSKIEIIVDNDPTLLVGTKRRYLLEQAKGQFIVFIDDDDKVSDDYIRKIVRCIETNPEIDCIAISGLIKFDGQESKHWHISKEYGHWYEKDNVYYRTPNHISPVRRELALQASFEDISIGEDFKYSMALLPLLKKEAKINGLLYFYDYKQAAPKQIPDANEIFRKPFR